MKVLGFAIHFLTASGAVCAFFAVHFAMMKEWNTSFTWLGIALVIDGIDGPLARQISITQVLPRFSGERLDLIVDYLNYVAVPAFILFQSQMLPFYQCIFAVCTILLSSLFHFADLESKTNDGFFIGFPAIWNLVVFYVFIFQPEASFIIFSIMVFTILTFIPLKWPHPLRLEILKIPTIIVSLLWMIAAIYALSTEFQVTSFIKYVFAGCALYFLMLTIWRSLVNQ